MLKNIKAFLFFLLGFLPIAQAQKGIPMDVKENIKTRVDNGTNTGIVIGLIDSDGTHFYSYGVKSLDGKEPVDEHSVFEIGSISKTFTGILLADLVVKGEVKLDDPLQKYLPEGVTAPTRNGKAIQLVQLSNHTSALPVMPTNFHPANPANPFADYTEKALFEFLNTYELPRDIGASYEYSNYAAGLLGQVLAAKQNLTYEALMVNVIAEPLGLKNTCITFTPQMKKNLAMGHSRGQEVENWDIPTLAGAGAIRSTVVDMLQYVTANMGKTKSSLYPAMQLSHQNTRKEGSKPMVGLGWHLMPIGDQEIVWHNGGTGGYRTFAGFINGGEKGVVVLSNSNVSVDDIGVHLLNPASPLQEIKTSIGVKIRSIIDSKGMETGINAYRELKKNQADKFEFAENELNTLGYQYLNEGEIEKAIAVFQLNVEAYPSAFNVYDSMGEAYLKKGDKEKAITLYKKAVELNPAHEEGIAKLKELGADIGDLVKEVIIADQVLETYVGKYELMPGFVLTITKAGNQMKAQATGQPEFPIFPKTENVFYFKVVPAQLTFNKNGDGEIERVTLLQGGQEIVGKRVE